MSGWIHFDYGDGTEAYLTGNFEGEGFEKDDFSHEEGKAIYIENHDDGATVTEIPFGEELDRLMKETSSYLNYEEHWNELDEEFCDEEFCYDRAIKYLAENQFSLIDEWETDNNVLTTTVAHTQTETSVSGLTELLKENGIDIDNAKREGEKFNYISETVLNISGENGILEIMLYAVVNLALRFLLKMTESLAIKKLWKHFRIPCQNFQDHCILKNHLSRKIRAIKRKSLINS